MMSPLSVLTSHSPDGVRSIARDGRVAVDLGAERARALGERLGEVGGLDVAVVGVLDGADDAVGLAERPDLLDLVGRQHVDLDADRLGDAGVVHVLVPAVPRAGEADVGDLAEADILPGLGLERLVEADRVFVDLADRVAEVEERQEARRHARSSRRSAPSARPARHRTSPSWRDDRASTRPRRRRRSPPRARGFSWAAPSGAEARAGNTNCHPRESGDPVATAATEPSAVTVSPRSASASFTGSPPSRG